MKKQKADVIIAVLDHLIKESYETAAEHKFHDKDYAFMYRKSGRIDKHGRTVLILSRIALIMSELGEAVEAMRLDDNDKLAEELADTIIRIFDTSACFGLDLPQAILRKMQRNKSRSHMHGGKLA